MKRLLKKLIVTNDELEKIRLKFLRCSNGDVAPLTIWLSTAVVPVFPRFGRLTQLLSSYLSIKRKTAFGKITFIYLLYLHKILC